MFKPVSRATQQRCCRTRQAAGLKSSDPSHISPFERIRNVDGEQEYWSTRDLATILNYTQWRNFEQTINRAIRACRNSGQDPADHFAEVSKMVSIGSGARRKLKDYQLSRYACYLIEMCARKPPAFAVRRKRALPPC